MILLESKLDCAVPVHAVRTIGISHSSLFSHCTSFLKKEFFNQTGNPEVAQAASKVAVIADVQSLAIDSQTVDDLIRGGPDHAA